ncbi:hypothetical protein [Okeania sp. SIO1I7]|uniref:hypothetical protein n=1 Tax=Okeania sp. SIO1I7 TaxID=2607772 RepID=UPI0013F79196|nr:hypothetical protein [Okeania sp. SIO1I7]NET26856.1 hypothetical protein [Okeania sp. SIO1I7]
MALAEEWRDRGYYVIFQEDYVVLFPRGSGNCYKTLVDEGKWMRHDDEFEEPWVKFEPSKKEKTNFEDIAAKCYCFSLGGGICDYCSGEKLPSD